MAPPCGGVSGATVHERGVGPYLDGYEKESNPVASACFSPDGNWVAYLQGVFGVGTYIKIFRPGTKEYTSIRGHEVAFGRIRIAPEGGSLFILGEEK